jgi:hypothetical protein
MSTPKRYNLAPDTPAGIAEAEDGCLMFWADHEAIVKRQAAAARMGMDAATRISSGQLEQAHRLLAESSPDALESERQANAVLTEETERLRAENARLESLKSTFAHNAAMLGAKNSDLRRILREINERYQAHDGDIGDLLESGLSG